MKKMPNLLRYYMLNNSETVYYKKINNDIDINIIKTICAMLNKNGGYIFLDITNKKDLNINKICSKYIKPKIIIKTKKYLNEHKVILCVFIMNTFEIYTCNNKYYYRKNNKNLDITFNEKYLSKIFINKNSVIINKRGNYE